MDAIADALIYAAAYIRCRSKEFNGELDSGDRPYVVLMSLAQSLESATPQEQDALAAAADRAHLAEISSPGARPEFVHAYAHWMEDMFDHGWDGNRRISAAK